MYERGNVVSTLYPFRESFYGRMGYVMLSQIRRWKCRTADLAQLIQRDFPGSVEMSHIRDQWEIFNHYLDERQQAIHGLGLFPQSIRDWQRGMLEQWIVIARDQDGKVIGAMPYRISGFRERYEVPSFFSSNPLGRYLLLQWAGQHVDQTTEFDVKLAPFERPETWLADLEMRSDPDIWITPLGRVLDVRGLSGIGAGDGEISVRIQDASCAWNNLTVRLTGSGGTLDVTPVSHPAELELTINGLSALVYGTNDPDDFQWRGWGNPTPAQAAILRRMFPIAQPWLYSLF
jgi:predicted acetyltransferase